MQDNDTRQDAQPRRWQTVAESNAIEARAKLHECLAALDFGDLRSATVFCEAAAAKLRCASVFEYVDRCEHRQDVPAALVVKDSDDLAKLRLPVALLNRLDNASICTVDDLTRKSERDLRRTRGIGAKFISLIKGRLALAGLCLAEDSR